MNIYLKDETNFERNGLGFLTDCIEANVTESLNGDYYLEFEYPLNANLNEYLVEENIVKCNVGNNNKQLFRIRRVIKTYSTIQVYATHITYDLIDNFLLDTYPQNLDCQNFGKWILNHTNFENSFDYYSDITGTKTARYVRRNPIEAIMGSIDNSMLSLFGGDIERDNYLIKQLARRGNDNHVKLMFGKNITEIKITIDISSLYTRIIPVAFDGILLPEKYVDSELINDYLTPKITTYEFPELRYSEDEEDEEAYHILDELYEAMRDATKELFKKGIDKPNVNIKIDWVELSKTEQYKNMYQNLERVNLGDTIYADILGISYTTRVIKTKYNVLSDRIDNYELGSLINSIATSMNATTNDIEKINPNSILETARENATSQINNAMGGYVYKTNNELFIMDTDSTTTAKNVWRWNIEGLGFSNNGIFGPYNVAMTNDGQIVADMITTGTMKVERIEGLNSLQIAVNSTQNKLNNITNENGEVNKVVTETVTIDEKGLSVANSESEISTLMTNDSFVIKNYDTELAKFNNDGAYLDNMTVNNYLTTGYHRIEKYKNSNEEPQTGFFFVGESD